MLSLKKPKAQNQAFTDKEITEHLRQSGKETIREAIQTIYTLMKEKGLLRSQHLWNGNRDREIGLKSQRKESDDSPQER